MVCVKLISMTSAIESFEIRGFDMKYVWDYENAFMWFSDPSRLLKLTAHYELFKQSLGLPGDIIEFGTYKANSLIRFATFRHLFEADDSRKIFAFDAFGDFPTASGMSKEDLAFVDSFESAGGPGLSTLQIEQILSLKGFKNIQLIQGDVATTLPTFLNDNPNQRFSLIHLDCDTYEPTKVVLENLWNRVVRGGVMIFDDYGITEGETRAVDYFLNQRKELQLHKLGHYQSPAYLVKTT